ncbi:hypothetical protein chiPu_0031879, partial [Chiloscyllium punctatum]|nr:hypothetical protein [Chiloscyllium punctatum]
MVGERAHAVGVAAGSEELEGADADVAGGDPGQHRTRQRGLAHHRLAGDDGSERAGGRDAQGEHRLADDVFAQDRTERGAAIAAARERCWATSLELDVAAEAALVDDFAEQDGAAVAELGNKVPELVAGIGHGDRVGPLGQPLAGEDFGALRCCQQVRIQPELDRQRPVQLDQPGGGHGGRRDAGKKVRRQRRIGVLERKMDG